jgi:hypothetical protein
MLRKKDIPTHVTHNESPFAWNVPYLGLVLDESWGRGAEGHTDREIPPKIPHWKDLQENAPVLLTPELII